MGWERRGTGGNPTCAAGWEREGLPHPVSGAEGSEWTDQTCRFGRGSWGRGLPEQGSRQAHQHEAAS